MRARIAALSKHAQYDPKDSTKPAREVFLARFQREVDPTTSLPPAERQRRADAALKAHMTKLALASSRARSKVPVGS
jgi:hypothetical protein